MNQLNLTHHAVQFHCRYTLPSSTTTNTLPLVSLVQILEQKLNSNHQEEKHRLILVSDHLLHINDKQLRVSIESNGDIDIAWTLNVRLLLVTNSVRLHRLISTEFLDVTYYCLE
jgi:hypothetical protein